MPKQRSIDEIRGIAKELMESLRPKHLAVFQIRQVAQELATLADYIVLREEPKDE